MQKPREYSVEMHGAVALLTVRRPAAMNALTLDMLDQFAEEWPRLAADPAVRAVLITGEGERGFSAGIDLSQTDLSKGADAPSLNYAEHWIARLQALPKPTIAAVNGVAAGGGLALALGCDIRLAVEHARFTTSFSRIGMSVIDGVGHTLVQAVGLSRALELVYTADVIDAATAERIGLVSHVYAKSDFMEKAMGLAQRIAEGPPMALSASKHAIYSAVGRSFAESLPYQFLGMQLNYRYAAADIQEGGKAFREKRKPNFRGPG
jgi:enoyl-CoA hydratase/carnithine racemase